jgi:ribonuclease J
MSRGAKALIEASDLFIPTKANLRNVTTFKMWKSFTVGDLVITPQLVDHSAFDAAAFLIQGEGKRILYSGDFRGHGRKRILFDNMILHPIKDIDYLLLEGSMLGRGEGQYQDERAVEDKMASMFKYKQNIAFVFCSSQNIDRIVSIYRASKRTGQTLLISLYTAYILNSLKGISNRLPQYWWRNIKVMYFPYHAAVLANNGLRSFLLDCFRAKIEKNEFNLNKKNIVMITSDNYDFTELLDHVDDFTGAQAVYSMWEGYLEDSDLNDRLRQKGISLESVHTSGHATERDLQKLAKAFSPRCLIPIHTFQPGKYPSLFPNVHILNDGEEFVL